MAMHAYEKGSGRSGNSDEKECFNCHKKEHLQKDCQEKKGGKESQGPKGQKWEKKANQAVEGSTDLNDLAFISIVLHANNTEFLSYDWILDPGTTSHIYSN